MHIHDIEVEKTLPVDETTGLSLLSIDLFDIFHEEVILPSHTTVQIDLVIKELLMKDVLATYNFFPARKIQLQGEEGTGKTLSAKLMSSELKMPLIRVPLSMVVSANAALTIMNLQKVFKYISKTIGVVLFEEGDLIGEDLGNKWEEVRIERAFNNMFRSFSGDSILIIESRQKFFGNTDYIIPFELADYRMAETLLMFFLRPIKRAPDLNVAELARLGEGLSPYDIKKAVEISLKRSVIDGNPGISDGLLLDGFRVVRALKKVS